MEKKCLFDRPIVLNNGFEIKNRFFKSAMSEQLGSRDHAPQRALSTLYETWSKGGVGLMVTGNVMIDRRALGEPRNVVLENDRDLADFKRWAESGHKNGSKLWMQLNHPGKQVPSFLSKEPVAPSAISLGKGLEKTFNKPRALTEDEIHEIIQRFAMSAGLAKKAGFSGVQIHGAHGYLISQFLSTRHNQRNDMWGGTPRKRMRFLVEVYKAIRAEVGEHFPIGVKLNSADFMKDGLSESESMAVIETLSSEGVNLIEISGGTYESPQMLNGKPKSSTERREAYFMAYADKARELCSATLVVTGGFRSGSGMTHALASGSTDMIGLARPLAVEPNLPNALLSDVEYRIEVKNPSTGVKWVDSLIMVNLLWFEMQIRRIAKGKKVKENLGAWSTVVHTLLTTGFHAFQIRRSSS